MSELTQQAFVDKIAQKTFYENGENLPEDIRQFIDFSLQKGIAVTNDACANSLSEIILQHEFMFRNQSINEDWFRDELLNVHNIVNRQGGYALTNSERSWEKRMQEMKDMLRADKDINVIVIDNVDGRLERSNTALPYLGDDIEKESIKSRHTIYQNIAQIAPPSKRRVGRG